MNDEQTAGEHEMQFRNLAICYRRKQEDGRRERSEESLCRCYEIVADAGHVVVSIRLGVRASNVPAIKERKILVRPLQQFTLKIYKEAYSGILSQAYTRRSMNKLPRIVSFLSLGIPSHSRLRPSTMSRHSSRASRSVHRAGSRYASNARMASSGDADSADGISRTSLLRISPTDGPPRTRMISEDEPPSSETGRT
jgi:hypothetical protein